MLDKEIYKYLIGCERLNIRGIEIIYVTKFLVTQLLYQLLHIYKIYKIYTLKY